MRLPSHCPAIKVDYDITIPAFGRHVTLLIILSIEVISLRYAVKWAEAVLIKSSTKHIHDQRTMQSYHGADYEE
jgi:hypothetical protein